MLREISLNSKQFEFKPTSRASHAPSLNCSKSSEFNLSRRRVIINHMKKVIPFIAGVIILVLVLVAINPHYFQIFYSYIFNSKSTEQMATTTPAVVETVVPTITFKTITDQDPGGKWKFSAKYPVFDSTLGPKFSAVNSQIEAEIQVVKLQVTGDVSGDISPENSPPSISPFEITLTSDATTSTKFGTASVLYSTFVDGGLLAHPYTNFESHTFSLSDGTEKQLSDFFTSSDYLTKISEGSKVALVNYYSGMGNSDTSFLNDNDGLSATTTNFDNYMLSNDSLILQFAEYQLGSRPYGAPRIEVPFSDITTD